jgi:glycosyltransferase involved in cell wall biosynthesis
MEKLVSCVLCTGNRPGFFRQALRCFLRQTWEDSELVVVDDGEMPVEDLCRGLFRVRYIRVAQPTCLGAKLNVGIRHARAEFIQKLDDDDYYHPEFLERGMRTLRQTRIESSIAAWDCFYVLLAGDDRVRHSGHGWAAGGTLLFHRALWQKSPFRELHQAVDAAFLEDHPGTVRRVCAPHMYLVVRHGRNTWKTLRGSGVDSYFRRQPAQRQLSDVVEPLDCWFYSSLPFGAAR